MLTEKEVAMRFVRTLIALFVLFLPSQGLYAQATVTSSGHAWPTKPVRLISPFPPGGGTDAVARVIATALGEQLGQQVIVDSRGGASGAIGVELAAKSPADGYTMVMGNVIPLAMLPSATVVPYVALRDFIPISLTALTDYTLTVHPSLPVRSIKDLIALAKK